MNSITGIPVWQNNFNGISVNPLLLIIVIVVIILYIILFGSLGNGNIETSETHEMKILSIILISLFIVLFKLNNNWNLTKTKRGILFHLNSSCISVIFFTNKKIKYKII